MVSKVRVLKDCVLIIMGTVIIAVSIFYARFLLSSGVEGRWKWGIPVLLLFAGVFPLVSGLMYLITGRGGLLEEHYCPYCCADISPPAEGETKTCPCCGKTFRG